MGDILHYDNRSGIALRDLDVVVAPQAVVVLTPSDVSLLLASSAVQIVELASEDASAELLLSTST